MFTNKEAKNPEDLKGVKMWAWTDDPIGRRIQEQAGLSTVPLGVPDVLSSLQTGLIDAFYTAPYAAIALQWFTKAKYIIDLPLALSVGAIVMTKSAFDALSPAYQGVVREVTAKWTKKP